MFSTSSKQFKVALLGKSGSGKTTLMCNLCSQSIPNGYSPTIGLQIAELLFSNFSVQFAEAGSSSSQFYHSQCLQCINAVIFCISSTDFSSLEWVIDQLSNIPNVPCVVALTKHDLWSSKQVSTHDLKPLDIPFFKTSLLVDSRTALLNSLLNILSTT